MADLKYLYPGGFESLTPGDTATGITSTVRHPADGVGPFFAQTAIAALITVENNSVRFTMDGTTPTASVGHLLTAGQSFVVENEYGVLNFKCIDAVSGSAGVVKVTVYFERFGG